MNIDPGDVVHLQMQKANDRDDCGLRLEEYHGKIYIRKVTGLAKRRGLPLDPGDELLSLNGSDIEDYDSLATMKIVMKREMKIFFSIRKGDPDASESTYEEPEQEEMLMLENGQERLALEYRKTFRTGDQYYLDGLKAKKYNGERVEIIGEGKKEGRWDVEVLSTKEVLCVPEDKLIPIDEYEANKEPLMITNEAGAANSESLLSVEGKPIAAGHRMKLRGIKKKAKMNGTVVTVLKLDARQGQWEVELPDGGTMSVASNNLRHV